MNIHHLELFYYVATFGGISRAARHMPYGIQQPAVSGQIIVLEQDLGKKLFERTPFRLTPEGEQLFAFIKPFFENIDIMARKLRQDSAPVLRLGAAELVLSDHLPHVLAQVRVRQPGMRLVLRSGFTPELAAWLQEREIDVAITPVDGKPPPRIRRLRLVRLPLVLHVPKLSKIRSAGELWSRRHVEEPLISLPAKEPIMQRFRQGLQRRKVAWPVAVEASSMDLVTRYVANGYGIGVTLATNKAAVLPGVRVLPLEGFEPLEISALWWNEPSPLVRAVLEEAQRYVAAAFPDWACREELT